MDQYEYIRTAYRVYKMGIRQIQRETGHSRVTIRKVLQGEFAEYRKRSTQPYPVLDENYRDTIERWLKEDRDNPKKQRHTARRIFMRLAEEEGYRGSEVTVRRYVRQWKATEGIEPPGTFLILEPECGREAKGRLGEGRRDDPGSKNPDPFLLHALAILRQALRTGLPVRKAAGFL